MVQHLLDDGTMITHRLPLLLSVLALAVPACATDPGDDGAEDGENDVASGKADSPSEGSADAKAILALANDIRVQNHDFHDDVKLSTRVADAIVAYRDGPDQELGNADDNTFDTLAELDAIPYLGPAAMTALKTYARAHANTTTLRIDLVGRARNSNGDWSALRLDTLNTQLTAAGLPPFPKQLTLGMRDGRKFTKVLADIEAAKTKLGRDIEMDYTWDPSDYTNLCYSGDVKQVTDTVEGLRYSLFSIYMGVQAERWGTKKLVHIEDNEAAWIAMQLEQGNTTEINVWKNFVTTSTDYLMMTDGGQQGDGTEFFAVRIKRCP
jgi:hypothetical protein